jgi:hypothetical protein
MEKQYERLERKSVHKQEAKQPYEQAYETEQQRQLYIAPDGTVSLSRISCQDIDRRYFGR